MIDAVLAALAAAAQAERPVALATLVATAGSTYRRPGARAVVHDDGQVTGLVSGGCLEADLAARAAEVVRGAPPRIVRYDLRDPRDRLLGLGGGCQGALEIFVEAVPARGRGAELQVLLDALARGEGGREHLVLDGKHAGERHVVTPGGERDEVAAHDPVRRWPGARVATLPLPRRARLVVCGAGADAGPLVAMARLSGFFVTVVDRRAPALARLGLTPGFAARVHAPDGAFAASLRADAVVVMTHHLATDLGWARAFVAAGARYVALLGPRARGDEIRATLAGEGLTTRALHGPAGLDVGGEGPAAVALSIVAEAHAVLAGRAGGSLGTRAREVQVVGALG